MDACEEYARRWAKKDVDTLSLLKKSFADVLKRELDDFNALSTPDTSQFPVTLKRAVTIVPIYAL